MNYYFDCEFIESFHKPFLGKRRHFIDLVSIGIVAGDGREYYAISSEWNYSDASSWVKSNIIHNLPMRIRKNESVDQFRTRCRLSSHYNGKWYDGKPNAVIAKEIIQFVSGSKLEVSSSSVNYEFHHFSGDVSFYGYYSDYDWVLLCSLFGTMMDLPKGFPMYCIDLKQKLDEKALQIARNQKTTSWTLDYALDWLKGQKKYPLNPEEHHALSDARFNRDLAQFLNNFRM